MSAVIMEYKYEHAQMEVAEDDWEKYDFVIVSVFDVELVRLPVPCWKYWDDGERAVCEEAITEWLKGSFK